MDKEQTLIFGIRSVKEAIDSNKSLNRVYIQRGLKGVSAFDLIKTLHKKNIEISYVPIEKLNRMQKLLLNLFEYKLYLKIYSNQ